MWNGTSEGTTSLPRSAVTMPAPEIVAASITSSVAPRAPAPTRKVTRCPALMMSAARRISSTGGVTPTSAGASLVRAIQCAAVGSTAFIACTSCGSTITHGCLRAIAVRNAVSMTACACAGETMVCTYAATSANVRSRLFSCCENVPSESRPCCPTIATTGWLSIFAS